MSVRGVRLAGLVLVAALAACGDDGGSAVGEAGGAEVALDDLIDRLPGSELAASVDLVALREQLGLDDDDDLSNIDDDATRRGSLAAALAIPWLASPHDDLPVQEAIDLGQVDAAASVPLMFAPDEAVVVMASGQDPDDIRAAFEALGWQDVGDGVLADDGADVSAVLYTAFGAAEGLIVLGQDAGLVADVLAGPAGDRSAAAQALELVDGAVRVARSGGDPDACGETVVAAERLGGGAGGELVVSTGPEGPQAVNLAEGDRFTDRLGADDRGFWVVDSISQDDGAVRLAWSHVDDAGTASTLSAYPLRAEAVSLGWLLDC